MPYDPEKDKLMKQWECEATGLVVSINRYDDSDPKLQIGPRLYTRRDGARSQRKAGRLSLEDVMWLYEIIDEVKEELMALVPPK